jgi:hypothetical protein
LSKILHHDRAAALKALGKPSNSNDMMDAWSLGDIDLDVGYYKGRVYKFTVQADGADQQQPAIRAWLSLPDGDSVKIGGREYHVKSVQYYFTVEDAAAADNAVRDMSNR